MGLLPTNPALQGAINSSVADNSTGFCNTIPLLTYLNVCYANMLRDQEQIRYYVLQIKEVSYAATF